MSFRTIETNKSDISMFKEKTNSSNFNSNSATLVSAGTNLTGDLRSENDLRVDGTIQGNVYCSAKIIIGATGVVEGNIQCVHADISGRVVGDIEARELLQLHDKCQVEGNIKAGKLQVEPTAIFNGRCQMQEQGGSRKGTTKHESKPAEETLYQ